MKIAVYSGSFDPLHVGHKAIMQYLAESGEYDWTYLVISPQNPFKDPEKALTAKSRYDAAVKAVARHPGIKASVDDIELRMPPPHYTIRTLDALRKREPGNTFTLVVGGDNLESMRRWKDYKRILLEYGIVVYPRPGYDADADMRSLLEENPDYRITLIEQEMVDVSSTMIREAIAQGRDASAMMM